MNLKTRLAFLRARRAKELSGKGEQAAFWLWNGAFLLLSSLAVTAVSLTLAIGLSNPRLYLGYFQHPLIFVLNWLPFFLLQLFLTLLLNRQWLGFLLSSSLLAAGSIGSFYKYQLRYEPFVFSDFSSIGAAMEVAAQESLRLNSRVILMLACVLVGTLFLAFFVRGGLGGKSRVAGLILLALSVWPLWQNVYSSTALYESEETRNDEYIISVWSQQVFLSKGFVYPFLYSAAEVLASVPEDYDPEEAAALLASYTGEDIPADKRVNLMVFQVESYCDLSAYGMERLDESAFAWFHQLEQESYSGKLIPNVIGGGTIETEQAILSGSYGHVEYRKDAPSHVRYFNEQGYFTTGSHPNRCDYYNRVNTNAYLGFQEYLFNENHYLPLTGGSWSCDSVMIPECFRLFREKIAEGEQVFSFNVSLQNHIPYESTYLIYEERLWEPDVKDSAEDYVVNNYLGSLKQTQALLQAELEELRQLEEPVVCLIYGDHKPAGVLGKAGIHFDQSTAQGQLDYYETPYYIWANDAAKALCGNNFRGEGPAVSPGYLLNLCFEQIGWKGSAWMQFTSDIMEELPVLSTNGIYLVDGQPGFTLPEEEQELLRRYRCVQHYRDDSF